ncbi:tryptophan 2,3-dioxygenase [Cupriavidus oxalaticus]|uniref:Tryptophan 2,3-dioxygenase n=1 Tax=Cupriavidus oxalaticus TaxID=96344 RepID=A0A5P3VHP8_9BURK|nr:tryptophan 2,3-dioxygenase family protein [Cupriavidus oxalaticus]QEZ44771.1 tryptophan 2,3-dioxygenase [Cupriavidus oxalaticus]
MNPTPAAALATSATSATPDHGAAGHTPYSAWLQTDALHSLQRPVSDHPGEYGFIIAAQVSELYWMLIIRDLQAAQGHLRAADLGAALGALQRAIAHHVPLNATWRSIAWMTPNDLLAILSRVGEAHGKDTALQGWTYRHMVYLLGIKQREHLQHFVPQPGRWAMLNDALSAPSLYDDVLAYLSRAGLAIPGALLDRDLAEPYVPHRPVEQAWRDIYANPGGNAGLVRLGETLADLAEAFTDWKYRHLMATRRTFGTRPAYFGTEGIAWLKPTLDELPFPELWSARSVIGEPPPGCPHHARG